MASNLVILHSGYQMANRPTAEVEASYTVDSTSSAYPQAGVLISDRNLTYKSTLEDRLFFVIDMNDNFQFDYLYIQRADMMANAAQGSYININFAASASVALASAETASKQLSWDTNLVGPNSEDFILETGIVSDYRFAGIFSDPLPINIQWQVGALTFGPWFDPGREPHHNIKWQIATNIDGARKNRRSITLKWLDIAEAAKTEFQTYIDNYKNVAPVVLYDRNDYVFDGHKCVQCKVKNVDYELLPLDKWNITANFEELI